MSDHENKGTRECLMKVFEICTATGWMNWCGIMPLSEGLKKAENQGQKTEILQFKHIGMPQLHILCDCSPERD